MEYNCTITLTEEMLATCPGEKKVYTEFVAAKREAGVDPAEVESLPPLAEELENGSTIFRRADGKPIIYDYMIKGFFKDSCGALKRAPDTVSSELKAYKKEIDGLIFIEPRQIVCELPAGGQIGICERPLRAQTAQGERVALARSETVPAGTVLKFKIVLLRPALDDAIVEWLDYGKYRGLGQWRNSGKGRFSYVLDKIKVEKQG